MQKVAQRHHSCQTTELVSEQRNISNSTFVIICIVRNYKGSVAERVEPVG